MKDEYDCQKQIQTALRWTYSGYDEMVKKYPKAAKKSRIRKKWLNRYGESLSMIFKKYKPFLEITKTRTQEYSFSGNISPSLLVD